MSIMKILGPNVSRKYHNTLLGNEGKLLQTENQVVLSQKTTITIVFGSNFGFIKNLL